MNDKKVQQISIIGGGAAGMMAAAAIVESGADCIIHIFDKNDHLGAKVIISGGGRCNLTTGIQDQVLLLKKYTRGAQFLRAALSKFPPQKTYDWFEAHGVPLKVEDDFRVFPISNDGHDVVEVFERMFGVENVLLHLQTKVISIVKTDGGFELETNKGKFEVSQVIITTGGSAYRQTGSTGDGYYFAQSLGHSITKLGPSLNSFEVKEAWVKELSGISLPDAGLKYGKVYVDGPFLFTHFGISGPVTFSLSSHLAHETISIDSPLQIEFIPDSAKDFDDWEEILNQSSEYNAKKLVKTKLKEFFPQRFVEIILKISKIGDMKVVDLTKAQRQSLSGLLSGKIKLTLMQRRPGDEFVTAGGVKTEEVNSQTMESLITPHLYFAGEVLDIDAVTGGFNLQSSWATGYLAGMSISKKLRRELGN